MARGHVVHRASHTAVPGTHQRITASGCYDTTVCRTTAAAVVKSFFLKNTPEYEVQRRIVGELFRFFLDVSTFRRSRKSRFLEKKTETVRSSLNMFFPPPLLKNVREHGFCVEEA